MELFVERGRYLQALRQQLNMDVADVRSFFKPAVTIRPVHPDDGLRLYEMHQRLSRNTIFYRYLRPYRPALAEMEKVASLQGSDGMGIVATQAAAREEIVGVAYYVVDPKQAGTAEPAILVADRFQGQGIGSRLFQRLSQHALAHGIHCFEAVTHPANLAVMRLIESSGFPFKVELGYGERIVHIQLNKTATPGGSSLGSCTKTPTVAGL